MENKQKPSNLRLYHDHHDFDEEKSDFALFNEEMLSWPIYIKGGEKLIENSKYVTIHRNAIIALSSLVNFETKIALDFDLKSKKLAHAHRTWGEISLNGFRVLSFSHDTRTSNHAFYSLYEWPELCEPGSYKHELVEKELYLWSSDRWTLFFKERLIKRAKELGIKATGKMKDAVELNASAASIFLALF